MSFELTKLLSLLIYPLSLSLALLVLAGLLRLIGVTRFAAGLSLLASGTVRNWVKAWLAGS